MLKGLGVFPVTPANAPCEQLDLASRAKPRTGLRVLLQD